MAPIMRCGAAARKLRVGIQRQHIADLGSCASRPALTETGRRRGAAVVQIQKLAAFALPAHPGALARIVRRDAGETEETSVRFGGILLGIEIVDEANSQIDAAVLVSGGLASRIRQIGEQRVKDMWDRGSPGTEFRYRLTSWRICFSLMSSVGIATMVAQSGGTAF